MVGHAALVTMLDFVGPDDERIPPSQLPPRGHTNWSVRQKALVVAAVRHGMLTIVEACELYDLSLDEFLAWLGTYTKPLSLDDGRGRVPI